jgi:UTP-glucose-1-phosphate uridylyltransferase
MKPGKGGEIQLTDALKVLATQETGKVTKLLLKVIV